MSPLALMMIFVESAVILQKLDTNLTVKKRKWFSASLYLLRHLVTETTGEFAQYRYLETLGT